MAKLPPPSKWRGTVKNLYVLHRALVDDGSIAVSDLHPSLYSYVKDLIDKKYVVYRRNKNVLVPTPRGRCYFACILYSEGWIEYWDYCTRCRGIRR